MRIAYILRPVLLQAQKCIKIITLAAIHAISFWKRNVALKVCNNLPDNVNKFRDYLPPKEDQILFVGDCWDMPIKDMKF